MSGIVVDASVALAWCFPDEASDYADAVLFEVSTRGVVVPAIWTIEIANALWVAERRKRIRDPEVVRFSALLGGLRIVEDSPALSDALTHLMPLSRKHNLSAYDAAYLEVAIRRQAPLATLDAQMREAAKMEGVATA